MNNYEKITPKVIWQLAAPYSWAPASIIPVVFAALLAAEKQGGVNAPLFWLLLASAVLLHSAANALNDYYDFIRGTDSLENSPQNDDAILVYNRYNPARVRLAGCGFLLAALLLGAFVVWRTNYIPLLIGALGALTVVAYSAGPQPLSYMPLGEFTSGAVMGLLLPQAVYAALTGVASWLLAWYCLPLALGIAMMMLTNNTCDIERDSAAGRKTLPIKLGRKRARMLHHLLMGLWLLLIVLLLWRDFRGGLFLLPLGLIGGAATLSRLFAATLLPCDRGYHMRDIYNANLWLNGSYTLCVLLGLLLNRAS